MAYWAEFTDGTSGCIEAADETAAKVAAQIALGKTVKDIYTLPYPGNPRLIKKKYIDRDGREYEIPSFCLHPTKCKNKSSCPRNYSCVE